MRTFLTCLAAFVACFLVVGIGGWMVRFLWNAWLHAGF